MDISNPKVMPYKLQIRKLKDIFRSLNPDVDVEEIDWEHEVDRTISFPEQRLEFKARFPMYKWFRDEVERESVRKEAETKLKEDIDILAYASETLPEEVRGEVTRVIEAFEKRAESLTRMRRTISKLRRELKEKPPVKVEKPPRITEEEVETLWAEFGMALTLEKIKADPYRERFLSAIDRMKTIEENTRIVERLVKTIVKEKLKPPPIPPREEVRRIVREEMERVITPLPEPELYIQVCPSREHEVMPDRPKEGFFREHTVNPIAVRIFEALGPQRPFTFPRMCSYHQRLYGRSLIEEVRMIIKDEPSTVMALGVTREQMERLKE